MMKVSIVVPVYNVEKYLRKCIDSILAQTFTDFELILIDDGSKDSSGNICDEYAEVDKRIVVIHKDNEWLSTARNRGLNIAAGEYILFIDSDDYIATTCLENFACLAEKYRGVDLIQGRLFADVDGVRRADYFDSYNFPEYNSDKDWIYGCLFPKGRVPIAAWNKLIRRDLILDNMLWFKEGVTHEDVYWTRMLYAHLKSISFCSVPSYYYRYNPDSIMSDKYYDKDIISWLMIFEEILSDPPSCLINRKDLIKKTVLRVVSNRRNMDGQRFKDVNYCKDYYKKSLLRIIKSSNVSFRHKLGLCYMLLPKSLVKVSIVSFMFKK